MRLIPGGQRCQTLHAIDTFDIKLAEDKCVKPIYEKLKQTKKTVIISQVDLFGRLDGVNIS